MPIPTPNLDDRNFLDLVTEALERIRATSPEWTDLGPGDPGVTLMETFAHLTEVMIYRLNRVPDKAYRAYLNLIGIQLWPPAGAQAVVEFGREDPEDTDRAIEIPRGTRLTVEPGGAGEPPTFVVTDAATLPAGEETVTVRAYHCEVVDAELVGRTSGDPGQTVRVRRPPIIRTGEADDLIVAVEAGPDELSGRRPAREHDGKAYRIFTEVRTFADAEPDDAAYVVDRSDGRITFGPALSGATDATATPAAPQPLALVPPPGREIRVWYRVGGGPAGNLAAGTLTTIVDGIPGLIATNPARATGGRAEEEVEHALRRGPQEFHHRERAVTARDYEQLALRSGAVGRSRAFARADFWTFAEPGSVEVVIVPHMAPSARPDGRVQAMQLRERATPEARREVAGALDLARPLGTTCLVNWAKYKIVSVGARVAVQREEDEVGVRARVRDRLHRTINPLPAGRRVRASQGTDWPGWPFGQSLRVSDVYDILLAEPGVVWADRVRLFVEEVPNRDISLDTVVADNYQAATWYAGAGPVLFRSMNDGTGWEAICHFDDENIHVVEPYPREPARAGLGEAPGYLAIATRVDGEEGSRVYVSSDLGETWGEGPVARFGFPIEDLAWMRRDNELSLFIATEKGLYEQSLRPDSTPLRISVAPDAEAELGFYRVLAYTEPQGRVAVVVAAHRARGIYRSSLAGKTGTFVAAGLEGEDVRTLEVQYQGTATWLWAGSAAEGGGDGRGAHRARLEDATLEWQHLGDGWKGGSCWGLTFMGDAAFGASHLAGVQRLDSSSASPSWWRPAVNCGLPLQEVGRFHPVRGVAARPDGALLLGGGPAGVYRSRVDGDSPAGEAWENASRREFDDTVTLPPTWLFASGDHELEVVNADEAIRD